MVLITIVGTTYLMYSYGAKTVQSECLAQTLDVNLDRRGPKKGQQALFEQQAAMAAEIHRRRVAQGLEDFCPIGNFKTKWERFKGFVEFSRRWALETNKYWRQNERSVVIRKAVAGEYRFSWPEEYWCVNDYTGSEVRRVLSTAKQWATLNQAKPYVGKIGNMYLYCVPKT